MPTVLAFAILCAAIVLLAAIKAPYWAVIITFGIGGPYVFYWLVDRHLDDKTDR